ncbi:hypothetical protein [Herbaspirillum robiniae]|uniref:hypothetical protein n=1 Tax=Herbaspirillum robiniae TaxID=2014887 RepID=UPI00101AD215|nr:hypothetical protein [Herbaspirillum robiniae]
MRSAIRPDWLERRIVITKENAPIGWTLLMSELEDAKEHLSTLIEDMRRDPAYGAANLRIDLGHVFSHLNRAWHRRDIREDLSEVEWKKASQFPSDIEPI